MAAAARWRRLGMDTADGERLGRFWAEVVGARFEPDGAAGTVVADDPGGSIALRVVAEPKTVKHRVHLDVYTADVADLEALGAQVVLDPGDSGLPWTVMQDPEGGEFCAFLRDPSELPAYRCHGVVVDSADPENACRWWAGVFGVEVGHDPDKGWWWLSDVPGMPITTMDFVPVPEPKTAPNRVHWHVYGDVEALEAAGARLLRGRTDDRLDQDVMADPEGNEFCVFRQ